MSVDVILEPGVITDINDEAGITVGLAMGILNTNPKWLAFTAEQTAEPTDMSPNSTTSSVRPLNKYGQVGHSVVYVPDSLRVWGYSERRTVLKVEAL